MKHKCTIKRIRVEVYDGLWENYWQIKGQCGYISYSKNWEWALNKALDHLEDPRIKLDHLYAPKNEISDRWYPR